MWQHPSDFIPLASNLEDQLDQRGNWGGWYFKKHLVWKYAKLFRFILATKFTSDKNKGEYFMEQLYL